MVGWLTEVQSEFFKVYKSCSVIENLPLDKEKNIATTPSDHEYPQRSIIDQNTCNRYIMMVGWLTEVQSEFFTVSKLCSVIEDLPLDKEKI